MYVISEESYTVSFWYSEIISGLRDSARKKHITLKFISLTNEINECDNKCVILIGSSVSFLQSMIEELNKKGLHPIILGNQSNNSFLGNYSFVSSDISSSIKDIFSELKSTDSTCLYAINPSSVSDISRINAFERFGGRKENVFFNEGSLEKCFDRFYKKHSLSGFDSVIASNDYAALSLIRNLKEKGEDAHKISIYSYSNTVFSEFCNVNIKAVSTNYKAFGQSALSISECINKTPDIISLSAFVKSKLDTVNETKVPVSQVFDDKFYKDESLLELMNLERLLSELDKEDKKIIKMLCDNKTEMEICEFLYLSQSAVKYRINRMKKLCGSKNRLEMCDLISKYDIIL